jgi:hypothetical protein
MRRIFSNGIGRDRSNPLGPHVAQRRAFFDPWRIMVRVAGHAGGRLPGNEEFR